MHKETGTHEGHQKIAEILKEQGIDCSEELIRKLLLAVRKHVCSRECIFRSGLRRSD